MASLTGTFVPGLAPAKPNVPYKKKIQRDRDDYAKTILGDEGPFTAIALFTIREGDGIQSVGTDPACSCIYSSSRSPKHLGEVTVEQGKASMRFVPELKATIKGHPVNAISGVPGEVAKFGAAEADNLSVMLSYNPARQSARLRIWDSNVTKEKTFAALSWFPMDPNYRVSANWIPFQTPKTITLPDSNGASREWKSSGSAEFSLNGQHFRLTPIDEPNSENPLFFVFGDSTNGRQTYGGGRFLYASAPAAGHVDLDFNLAINLLCAYNHRVFICPAPHSENCLATPISAGELTYSSPVS